MRRGPGKVPQPDARAKTGYYDNAYQGAPTWWIPRKQTVARSCKAKRKYWKGSRKTKKPLAIEYSPVKEAAAIYPIVD